MTRTRLKQAEFPAPRSPDEPRAIDPSFRVPCLKVLGASHGRRHHWRPLSFVNVSGMSFGSLSGAAVTALDQGAARQELLRLGRDCRHRHPGLVGADQVEYLSDGHESSDLAQLCGYRPEWYRPGEATVARFDECWPVARSH
ncbi:MAG: hypothetical protein V9E94_03790 [Microthrixaceae bacterium]